MQNDKKPFGENLEDQEYFVKKSMKWDGWGSPIGFGFFLAALGLFIFLLSQSGLF